MAEDTDAKHGGNGKKEGLSGSSFFTWFMVIALLGVWTSVAVVWFDLVDYEEVLAKAKDFRYNLSEVLQGKLGAYDADGDGDFDIEDAKVLLGLTDRIVKKQQPEDTDTDSQEPSEYISDEDLRDVLNDAPELDLQDEDANDLDEALDDHEDHQVEDDISDFNLEDAVEPSVHGSLNAEPEAEQVIEEEEEPETEQRFYTEDKEPEVEEQEEPATFDDTAEDLTPEVEAVEEQEVEPVIEVSESVLVETPRIEGQDETADLEEDAEAGPLSVEEWETEINQQDEEETHGSEDRGEAAVLGDDVDVGPLATEEWETEIKSQDGETEDIPETVTEEVLEVETEGVEVPDEQEGEGEHDHETDVPENQEYDPQEEYLLMEEEAGREEPENEDVEPVEETEFIPHIEEEELDEYLAANLGPESVHEEVEETAPETLDETLPEQEVQEENPVEDERPSDHVSVTSEDHHEGHHEDHHEGHHEGHHEHHHEHHHEGHHEVHHEGHHEDHHEGHHELHAGDESLSQEKKEKAKKKKPKLLNKFDKTIKAELDAAEKLRKKGRVEEALKAFEALIANYPQSPRARYGKAQCEDDLAEKLRSNDVLTRALVTYEEVAALPNVPADLTKLALKRRANRQQFLGRMRGSAQTLLKLVELYPDDVSLKNDLGVGYLLLGDNKKAREVYEEVLSMDPNNGFAKVHYGFILKADNKIAESIPYLREGLQSGEPGTDDGRFYFHLGDALQRVGDQEAYTWYEEGHKKGHFASVWQRSLYNVDGLKAQPWWTAKETGYTDLVRTLETNWKTVRDEGLAVMDVSNGLFVPEDENLREKGDWSQYTLWQQGRRNDKSCKAAPRTCALLERFPESTGCRRGQIKYSVMHPGTHVWPHTGPTNCRLRMHLGLVIPKSGCKIRCANDTRSWQEGKVLIFDDSFEHEVWQEADSYRLIFIVDVWHPELTPQQRRTLPAI
ncbi:aspartyl/asparaginyl beta-hydroxylase isoform X2 [Hyperolius riggenbachi]|uniref:aspartyl/asparaginyl beta-hydroxylase isoform X2 n=1 Tax=Hyperolius riggenbachi TaxID=752182 RepID=UPI0035A31AFD